MVKRPWPRTPNNYPLGKLVLEGRGLCSACYKRSKKDDTLLDYPNNRGIPNDIMVDEIRIAREDGARTWADVASALDVTPGAARRAWERHLARERSAA